MAVAAQLESTLSPVSLALWELFLRSAQSVQQQYGVGGAARPVAKLLAQSSCCSRRGGPPAVVPAVTGPLRSSSSSREKGTMRRSALLRAGKCTQNTARMPRARFTNFAARTSSGSTTSSQACTTSFTPSPAQDQSCPKIRPLAVRTLAEHRQGLSVRQQRPA